ncbi:MAG: hypothetical protein LBR38_00100 [Synergistaceae bacterium]|jgi:hypothetical protein|nr:hypothetical protein [Synergistaceae bacterium]
MGVWRFSHVRRAAFVFVFLMAVGLAGRGDADVQLYRPVGIPANWYITGEGYPVYLDSANSWRYGTYYNGDFLPTNYAVGAVPPSALGILPYAVPVAQNPPAILPMQPPYQYEQVPVAVVKTAPAPKIEAAPAPKPILASVPVQSPTPGKKRKLLRAPVAVAPQQQATPVYAQLGDGYSPAPVVPSYPAQAQPPVYAQPAPAAQPERAVYAHPEGGEAGVGTGSGAGNGWGVPLYTNQVFLAVGMWKDNVDRIGILNEPAMPVAWKGEHPSVIYAWSGAMWYGMEVRAGERPGDVLRNQNYALTRIAVADGLEPIDITYLIIQTGQFGYYWMGEIPIR